MDVFTHLFIYIFVHSFIHSFFLFSFPHIFVVDHQSIHQLRDSNRIQHTHKSRHSDQSNVTYYYCYSRFENEDSFFFSFSQLVFSLLLSSFFSFFSAPFPLLFPPFFPSFFPPILFPFFPRFFTFFSLFLFFFLFFLRLFLIFLHILEFFRAEELLAQLPHSSQNLNLWPKIASL